MSHTTPKKPIKSIKKQLKEHAKKVKAKCAYCGKDYDEKRKISLDHVTPKSSRGQTSLENLLVTCTVCNSKKKKSLSLEEFIKLNPKTKFFLNKYLNKMKDCTINGIDYYSQIEWVKNYI